MDREDLKCAKMGALSELAAASILLESDWEVFRNETATGPADLVVWNRCRGIMRLVDVKTVPASGHGPYLHCPDDRVSYLAYDPDKHEIRWLDHVVDIHVIPNLDKKSAFGNHIARQLQS